MLIVATDRQRPQCPRANQWLLISVCVFVCFEYFGTQATHASSFTVLFFSVTTVLHPMGKADGSFNQSELERGSFNQSARSVKRNILFLAGGAGGAILLFFAKFKTHTPGYAFISAGGETSKTCMSKKTHESTKVMEEKDDRDCLCVVGDDGRELLLAINVMCDEVPLKC